MASARPADPEAYLSEFGLSSFRPGQREVISAVLGGEDCLCVMPTGGGKSLCYQLPALILDGLTLVVSPLIALMKDQVDQLTSLGVPVSYINHTVPTAEQYTRLERMAAGEFRLVYVVPERFRSGRFLDAVRAVGLKLLAIDEAHCISEWGHDFRPAYARLGYFRRILGNPPTIALTATATDQVRRDIVEQLALDDPRSFITGFARENLFYEVQNARTDRQKNDLLLQLLRETPGSGIIYTSSRKRTEEIAHLIAQQTKRKVTAYHAGLLPDQRRDAQDTFMNGDARIVVATNAFGMGIDKSDVRFVVHYNLPGTLEAYYQEAGRAGRDGQPSRCLLLYTPSDRNIQEFFIESAYPNQEHVRAVYDHLRELDEDPIELTQAEVKEQLNLPIGIEGVGNCEQLLESAGVLERLIASQNMATVRLDSELPTMVDLLPKQAKLQRRVLQAVERLVGARRNELVQFQPRDLAAEADVDPNALAGALRDLNRLASFTYVHAFRGRAVRMLTRDKPFEQLEINFDAHDRRKKSEYEKLNRMIRFVLSGACRQREILHYFGEQDADRCGHCDNCRDRPSDSPDTKPAATDAKLMEAVRIVLSGVARTQAEGLSCGKNLIAQMLCGSGSAKMRKLRLNRLSTFGLLKHLKQTDIVTLIDGIIAVECLRQVSLEGEYFRPVIELTDLGTEVMKGNAPLDGHLPIPRDLQQLIRGESPIESGDAPASAQAEQLPPPDANLLTALQTWRREIAAIGSVPLYQILPNKALEDLARRRPTSRDELLDVHGIGPAKLSRFGEALLAVLAEGKSAATTVDVEPTVETEATPPEADRPADFVPSEPTAMPEVAAITVQPQSESTGVQPSHYWTWRLLSAGFALAECAAIRDMSAETVLDHALRAVESGWTVRPELCLEPELLADLEELIGERPPERIRPLLARLPEGTTYEQVELFVKCRRQKLDGAS